MNISKIFRSQKPSVDDFSETQKIIQHTDSEDKNVAQRYLDINSDSVLSDWELKHALREIIANALDETELAATDKAVQIYFEDEKLIIKDFGRGIEEKHFVQNESKEKQSSSKVIGKYGAGLKDAIAVFHKNGIAVEISSPFVRVSGVQLMAKRESTVKSLHLVLNEPKKSIVGTEITLFGISNEVLDEAKRMFLHFQNHQSLAKTAYGDIFETRDSFQTIYYKGLAIAEVTGFLFSYNIVKEDSHLRKNLNRERMNVGRAAWTSSIKNILKNCQNDEVVKILESKVIDEGLDLPEELKWKDIATFTYREMAEKEALVFIPSSQALSSNDEALRKIEGSGKAVVVPDYIMNDLPESVVTLEKAVASYENDYVYEKIPLENLEKWEVESFMSTLEIAKAFLKKRNYVYDFHVYISEEIHEKGEALGVWVNKDNSIYLKRSILKNGKDFAHTLFHEFAHAQFNHEDETRLFEKDLGNFIADLFADQYTNSKEDQDTILT